MYLIFLLNKNYQKGNETMMSGISIPTIHYEKAFVRPGEIVHWTVVVHSENANQFTAEVISKISHLDQTLNAITKKVSINEGDQEVSFEWTPPLETPRGYGLDVSINLSTGIELIKVSSGFDVLETWTQMPRYGFLSDFEPGRTNAAKTLQTLSDLHINSLQYYDWMYRHETLLTDHDPYIDPLGRTLSLITVNELIDEGHKHNIAAMPYTAIYAASIEFFNDHKDWALYYADGSPVYLGTNFLAYMDPRPDSEWIKHLLREFRAVLEKTKFDGIHLDQYGDPKEAYDAKGVHFKLDGPIAATITKTHEVVDQYRTDGAVVFNCVTNWPVELASQADEDIIYIEVWAPYTSFSDLHTLITYAQLQGTGKPVVLAAYVHPENSSNPFLMDAIIFASGGGRIELGESSGYLANPYFPDYDILAPEQTELLRNYYDFAVRYQNIIGPSTVEATKNWREKIKINGLKVGLNSTDDVFALVRESEDTLAVSLINITEINSKKWNEPADFPVPAANITFKMSGFTQAVKDVYLSTPDEETFSLDPVSFTQNGDEITLVIPSLKIWDLVVFKY
ncbi:MAG: glycoside hydrolase family 66 protein, partial [Bellilinea sp.]